MGMLTAAWEAAIEEWLREARRTTDWSETTRRTRQDHMKTAARAIGGRPEDVDDDGLLAYWWSREWRSVETRRTHLASHRAFWKWMEAQGRVEQSPAVALPKVKPGLPIPRPTPDHVVDETMRRATPRERLMVRLARECGLRRGEIAQGHDRDLLPDLLGWSLLVHGKGGRERLVPVPDDLAAALRALPRGYFFPGRDHGHLSARWVGKLLARLMPEGWTCHSLRHRFGTDALDESGNIRVVQELLGHAHVNTTEIYTAVDRSAMFAAVRGVSARASAPRERRTRRALQAL